MFLARKFEEEKIINELKLELSNLKNEQNSIIKEIEKDYEKDLEIKINKLKESYERKLNEINNNQNKKIYDLQSEIKAIKMKIDKYEKAFLSKNSGNFYSNRVSNINNKNNLGKKFSFLNNLNII